MAELRILLDRLHGHQQQRKRWQGQQGLPNNLTRDQQHEPDPAQDSQPARDQRPPQVWLVPVLYGLTVEEVGDMRALYDSQPWCVGDTRPEASVLERWAADLRAVARLTMIRPDQVWGQLWVAGVLASLCSCMPAEGLRSHLGKMCVATTRISGAEEPWRVSVLFAGDVLAATWGNGARANPATSHCRMSPCRVVLLTHTMRAQAYLHCT